MHEGFLRDSQSFFIKTAEKISQRRKGAKFFFLCFCHKDAKARSFLKLTKCEAAKFFIMFCQAECPENSGEATFAESMGGASPEFSGRSA